MIDSDLLHISIVPRPNPEANALKTGTAADCPRVPEDIDAVNDRGRQWCDSICPQNYYHCWLLDQYVVSSLRVDRIERIERRQRDRAALRAEKFWDDDRRLEAEILGEQIAKKPASIVNKLRRTPQGCDWLVNRWACLARIADDGGSWNADQKTLAFSLLGVPPEEQFGEPGQTIDPHGNLVIKAIGSLELARLKVDELRQRKQEVADADALDRAMAMGDYLVEPSPESKDLRRQDAALKRWMKWCLQQIHTESPYPRTKQYVYEFFNRGRDEVTSKQDQTRPEPTNNAPKPGVATMEHDENGNVWPNLIAERRNEQDMKQMAREEARRAKRIKRRLA